MTNVRPNFNPATDIPTSHCEALAMLRAWGDPACMTFSAAKAAEAARLLATPTVEEAAQAVSILEDEIEEPGYETPKALREALDTLHRFTRGPRPVRCGDVHHELDAYIWLRESTQQWVLEITGAINGESFISRHAEPLSTPPEAVAGLPSLYAQMSPSQQTVGSGVSSPDLLARAIEAFVSGYRRAYGNCDNSIRKNAPMRQEVAILWTAWNTWATAPQARAT